MASFVESPFLHARQMLSLNSSSSNPLTETRTSNTNMEQLIMPVHPISQNQKQVILPDTAPSSSSLLAQALAKSTPRRPRGEKRPIPDEQKDRRYYERRKRNNLAAKKSRDQRKQREETIAARARFLERENSVLRAQMASLKEEKHSLHQTMWLRRTQQQMLKEQKMQSMEAMTPSSSPVVSLSLSKSQIPTTSPLSISTGPHEHLPIVPTNKIENQNRPPFLNIPNPSLSLLNTIENCKGNPSAAAALVMMNALLASQQSQNGISKLAKENLVSEQNNIRPSTSFPFLPPPPPLRLSQPKSSTTDLNISPAALEQNIIAAKNAAAMMKLQATINSNDEITQFKAYELDKHLTKKDEDSTENCSPIDLSIIIKTNLMKNNDLWNSKGLLPRESTFEEHEKELVVRKALLNSTAINQIRNPFNKDETIDLDKRREDDKIEEEMDTALSQNFQDENCNIKVE